MLDLQLNNEPTLSRVHFYVKGGQHTFAETSEHWHYCLDKLRAAKCITGGWLGLWGNALQQHGATLTREELEMLRLAVVRDLEGLLNGLQQLPARDGGIEVPLDGPALSSKKCG